MSLTGEGARFLGGVGRQVHGIPAAAPQLPQTRPGLGPGFGWTPLRASKARMNAASGVVEAGAEKHGVESKW